MNLKEIKCESVVSIALEQDRVQWRSLMKTEVNF